ncbi:ATP-binding protein [Streptomyces sp. NPDC000070]|uniref:ATP-binding protein n=1 Tax=Streptomyces sp. NPDC000070 TaxID=3154240 RepID=UPI00333479DC
MPQPTTRARPTGCPGYSETLPREPESAGAARRLVCVALAAWGLDDLAGDGALIVSELVSNAVRHARCRSVRVTVTRPELREPCTGDESGRGLMLVGALAKDWGTDHLPWGKRVWAELHGEERR